MSLKATILDEKSMMRTMTRLAHEIIERNRGVKDVVLVGILSRGVPLAKLISQKIQSIEQVEVPVGHIDITLYRDDLSQKTDGPIVNKTDIGVSIAGKTVILVDDVIFTGRTVRAALDAVMDIARPKAIQLAVLVDRGHRELPIRPDYVGKNVPTSLREVVKVKVMAIDGANGVDIEEKTQ